jgi:hypothetical protein
MTSSTARHHSQRRLAAIRIQDEQPGTPSAALLRAVHGLVHSGFRNQPYFLPPSEDVVLQRLRNQMGNTIARRAHTRAHAQGCKRAIHALNHAACASIALSHHDVAASTSYVLMGRLLEASNTRCGRGMMPGS